MVFIDTDAESCEIISSAKKYRVRVIWDIPASGRTFKELGEALFYIANLSTKLELEYDDAEGVVFRMEVINEDFQTMLECLMHDFEHRFKRVRVFLEEVDRK